MTIDLSKGLGDYSTYKAWKFPGGELGVKVHLFEIEFNIIKTRINSSDDLILLLLIVDTLRKIHSKMELVLDLGYMPYQQADENFGTYESFSLKTTCNLINSMNFIEVIVFDPHSSVTPALLNNCTIVDNSNLVKNALYDITNIEIVSMHDIIIIAPDSGAYKKIFKLCKTIGFKGDIITCSKARDHETGELTTVVPIFDNDRPVLIIDDICLGGRTFINIAERIINNRYLVVSHGVFNNGVDHLLEYFEMIFTTDTKCNIVNDYVKIEII